MVYCVVHRLMFGVVWTWLFAERFSLAHVLWFGFASLAARVAFVYPKRRLPRSITL